jgi:hypothetical protein
MRNLLDCAGLEWRAEIVSHGRASDYLSRKVHRPIVQFTCLDRSEPRRYAPLPPSWGDDLGCLEENSLRQLLGRARPY